MTEKQVKKEMNKCLIGLRKAKDIPTGLMWQNVYFWWVRNYDKLVE